MLFIVYLSNIIYSLKHKELIYIHCKGGHGRSGVVVAILLSYIFKLAPEKALEYTTKYHCKRKVMREKWRIMGSPQTFQQKSFVFFCCKPVNFYRAYKIGFTAGFSNFSPHSVYIKDFGTFPTSEAALQAYKDPTNKEYIKKLENSISPIMAKTLGKKSNIRDDWDDISFDIMYKILQLKFDQHDYLKDTLMSTRLCPIIQNTRGDNYWGIGNGEGQNLLGKSLTKLRNSYYQKLLLE